MKRVKPTTASQRAAILPVGLEDSVGVENAADQHHEEATDGEVLEAEELEVDEGSLVTPLPDDEADHTEDEEEGEEADEGR